MLIGCDFSSRPGKHKPIVIARGELRGNSVRLDGLERLLSLEAFGLWLARPGDWLGGFDFPFGLPRELVQQLGWPTGWEACMRHYASLTRPQIRELFSDFCNRRPVGGSGQRSHHGDYLRDRKAQVRRLRHFACVVAWSVSLRLSRVSAR